MLGNVLRCIVKPHRVLCKDVSGVKVEKLFQTVHIPAHRSRPCSLAEKCDVVLIWVFKNSVEYPYAAI